MRFLQSVAAITLSKTRTRLNLKKLYAADGAAVRELLKLAQLLHKATHTVSTYEEVGWQSVPCWRHVFVCGQQQCIAQRGQHRWSWHLQDSTNWRLCIWQIHSKQQISNGLASMYILSGPAASCRGEVQLITAWCPAPPIQFVLIVHVQQPGSLWRSNGKRQWWCTCCWVGESQQQHGVPKWYLMHAVLHVQFLPLLLSVHVRRSPQR